MFKPDPIPVKITKVQSVNHKFSRRNKKSKFFHFGFKKEKITTNRIEKNSFKNLIKQYY